MTQAFLEISAAQDAQGDRAPFLLLHPSFEVGVALEQHRRAAESKLLQNFCLITVTTIFIQRHLIKISTSRFELFTVNYYFKVNYSKQNSLPRESMFQQALK